MGHWSNALTGVQGSQVLKPKYDPATELELIGEVGFLQHGAAAEIVRRPVRRAINASARRLDVGRRPTAGDAEAESLRQVCFRTGAERARKSYLVLEGHIRQVRQLRLGRTQTNHCEWTHGGTTGPSVEGGDRMVIVDFHAGHFVH